MGIVENQWCITPNGSKQFITPYWYNFYLDLTIKEIERFKRLSEEQNDPNTKTNKIMNMLQSGYITVDQSIKMLNSDKTIEEDLKELGISL